MLTQKRKMVTIGGGTGQFALLSGLRDVPKIEITAVVSMVDSGGSTGRLRDELGILPPGDILKCILALSPQDESVHKLFLKRFSADGRLKGHNAGNMLLTMLTKYSGSFPAGIQALAEILEARGTILPVTLDKATLVAQLNDGSRLYGERAIDQPYDCRREKILDVFLVPHHSDTISAYPPVIEAIRSADYVVIGPGDLFTSIVSNLIVPGVKEALQDTAATILYVVNIMTKFGETHDFSCPDFVSKIEKYIQRPVDGIVCNTQRPEENILSLYRKQKAEFVQPDQQADWPQQRKIYSRDLLDTSGGIVRHHVKKLATLILDIISEGSIA